MLHEDLWKVGLGFKGLKIQRFRGSEVQGFRGSGVQGLIARDYI